MLQHAITQTCTHWLFVILVILAGVDCQCKRIADLNKRVMQAAISRLVF
jgi:hypothetical protein